MAPARTASATGAKTTKPAPADDAPRKERPAGGGDHGDGRLRVPRPTAALHRGLDQRSVRTQLPGWVVSGLVHMMLLFVLAWTVAPQPVIESLRAWITVSTANDVNDNRQTELERQLTDPVVKLDTQTSELLTQLEASADSPSVQINDLAVALAASSRIDPAEIGLRRPGDVDLFAEVGGSAMPHGIEGRGKAERQHWVQERGGTPESEAAVALALEWLDEHQNSDGSWNFDHTRGPCHGRCRNPGSFDQATIGATAMGLLPFLGAGETHKEGKYRNTVRRGIYYIIGRMQTKGQRRGALTNEGRQSMAGIYSHGLATIALCEAYAMTQDHALLEPAQSAIDYITYHQDPTGGGWRYAPGSPGDTSVTGWQVMALKSGQMAYLRVLPNVLEGATHFLDGVQTDAGATYGYTVPIARPSTTSIGLLCRMYLGWHRDNPALERGVRVLSDRGPSRDEMYYNYYATQVLSHYDGPMWEKWNAQMRDYLVKSQAKRGHEKGSWFFNDPEGERQGGRLYITSLAALTLEVYYRYLPLYGRRSTDLDAPAPAASSSTAESSSEAAPDAGTLPEAAPADALRGAVPRGGSRRP